MHPIDQHRRLLTEVVVVVVVVVVTVGLAHLHHAHERVAQGTHTWSASLMAAMVQNTYTVRDANTACVSAAV